MTAPTSNETDRSPTALLLASDPAAAAALRRALESRGFDVRMAADGATGIGLLLDGLLDLDVVVTEHDLPGRDARSLVELVRGPGGEHDLAIVVLLPGAEPRARGRLLAAGADAVTAGAAAPGATADAAVAAIARRRAAPVRPTLATPLASDALPGRRRPSSWGTLAVRVALPA